MLWILLAVPAVSAMLAFALPWNWPRRGLLVATSGAHLGLTTLAIARTPAAVLDGWIALDGTSLLFLAITSAVFFVVSIYAVGYLAHQVRVAEDPGREVPFVDYPEAVFTGCLLLFLAAMTLVIVSRHWGLMWVAVEATTLASAPLIYFHRHPRSLVATWKYLVICSVGIALALLGYFFLAVSAEVRELSPIHLTIADLENHARQLDPAWLKAAFLLLLVGYGTKMGLAPLHTWLPDAHSEAPSMVSALLSGVLLNCAFLAILRGHSLLVKAGLGDFSRELLVLFGLVSMVFAAVFVIRQADYKRLLAYSSVEHMGILSLGAGIGGIAGFGSMLHAVNHSLTKAMLFLAAGNTLHYFHTKSTLEARGLVRALPVTALVWIAGLLAITGFPPFGPFLSELMILKGMIDGSRILVAVVYLVALAATLAAMAAIVIPMVYGEPPRSESPAVASGPRPAGPRPGPRSRSEPLWSAVPPLLLAAAVLVLGVYVPQPLSDFLHRAALAVGAE
jgi:hydrogenase-4 component F